ncbi:hypothetical protein O181_101746 [Austropuccinia psidii MF-1]|uniref:Uncharacterized protein n=1 Tax=Austropuccinia psidii MF-1 TaxID=1389203 RepID=A0A9Q3JHB8_9BASI|nr:hypothetical protein [Austropuccinia psidii MF-1]
MAKPTSGPKLTKDHLWDTIQSMASGNHQRRPAQLRERIPLKVRGRPFLTQCSAYSRIQEWCIYGIIHHYSPFLLSNPMVTFSGPNKVPNPPPISKKDVSVIQSGNSLEATRRPFKDPNHLALRELGCQFSSGLF